MGVISAIIRWIRGGSTRSRHSVTEALERVSSAERRLLTVEEATMSLTVADLPAGEEYEADDDGDGYDDWFEED